VFGGGGGFFFGGGVWDCIPLMEGMKGEFIPRMRNQGKLVIKVAGKKGLSLAGSPSGGKGLGGH